MAIVQPSVMMHKIFAVKRNISKFRNAFEFSWGGIITSVIDLFLIAKNPLHYLVNARCQPVHQMERENLHCALSFQEKVYRIQMLIGCMD